MSKFYSPLRYPGGKNCIFSFVANIFYENDLIGSSYAEPYAGGSGLALRLLFEGYVERIYINDLDYSIYSFWYSVLNHTNEFCEWIENVEVSIENWKKYKKIYNNGDSLNYFELGKATFFLNRTNISGVIKGGVIGGIKQKGKYKIDARFNKKDLIKRIKKISYAKNRINLSNLDGISFINKLNYKKEEIFIYLDPPYYKKGSQLYMNFFSDLDHRKLSKQVNKIKQKWMVSYDNHEFILNLYESHNKVIYRLSQSASNRVGEEVFVFPKKLNFLDSIAELKSPVCI